MDDFHKAIRSFVAYLENSGKADHTVSNYVFDLGLFERFLLGRERLGIRGRPTSENTNSPSQIRLSELQLSDLEAFHDWLKLEGQKANSRRRRIFTVRKFLVFAAKRNWVSEDVCARVAAPVKREAIPKTVDLRDLIEKLGKPLLPEMSESAISEGVLLRAGESNQFNDEPLRLHRARVLAWTLAESGCLVCEAPALKWTSWFEGGVRIEGKIARVVPVSPALIAEVQALRARSESWGPWLFTGFTRTGPMRKPITTRGAELLLKELGEKLGFDGLTPRMVRHSVGFQWLKTGVTQEEVKRRMGFSSNYPFRIYRAMLELSR